MKTDYKNINSFEVAVMGMILVGFILIGAMLFTGLTPRAKTNVAQAVNMFDIHQQTADSVNAVMDKIDLVIDIPNEFYNQFYIAFTEVATLSSEALYAPVDIATETYRNISVAINNLSDQVADGYAAQNISHTVPTTQVAYEGHVLGAVIDNGNAGPGAEESQNLFDQYLESIKPKETLNISFQYSAPNLDEIKSLLSKFLK